ncbi:MAG TPA: NrfD/PsrC family molybdoenzyme membrane anchor subunit, partial [Candidatus Binatia bacterium]|nr:NrfD/PsrC family molybdoenzyme membrane anchor subunit [Candidatus Binatia bacterium]
MSSTFFTATPQWRWLIVGYFFLGGLAAGSYVLATLMELFGRREDRPLVRLGYLIAFPAVCLCGLLLTADLGRPERFWHMLVQANTFRPMVKAYSPMSLGAWALMAFSGCAFLSFVAVL